MQFQGIALMRHAIPYLIDDNIIATQFSRLVENSRKQQILPRGTHHF
jgi:hypothetical protein